MSCIGCALSNKEMDVNVLYEDDYVLCILDADPFHDGHTLIIPKSHVVEFADLDQSTLKAVFDASILISNALHATYSVDGITMCHNGGNLNELGHYHLHVIPRYEGKSIYVDDMGDNTTFPLYEVRDQILRNLEDRG